MTLWQTGFDQFITDERDFNDGAQLCDAELQATHRTTGVTTTYYGSTKNLHGHAELDGVFQFLTAIGWSQARFEDYDLTIDCPSKPCCRYCSSILGHLGVFAVDGTYKSRKKMGVSYAIPPDLRTFLVRRLNVTENTILQQLCG
jgi:hypothetical protein